MARCKILCAHVRRVVSLRALFISSVLTLSSCVMVLLWTESYPRFDLWSHTIDHEQTTADSFTAIDLLDQQAHELSSLDQQAHELSSEDMLLRAVDKLPFKTMTPSSLLLEDIYFTPSAHKLVDYNNPVIHQPDINCSGSELLLILVPSHPLAVGVRRAIRETWGSVARGRAWPARGDHYAVKLLFVLGVAESSFQPGTIQNAETVGKQELTTRTLKTDSHLTRNKHTPFLDSENKASSALMTKNNSIMTWVYEKTDHGGRQKVDELTNVPDIQNGISNAITNRQQDSLQKWRHRNRTSLSNKPSMGADIGPLLNPDQAQTTITAAHTTVSPHSNNQAGLTVSPHSNNQAGLVEEMSSFGDILQFDMIDTYSNLTRKIILSLQLLLKTCPTVQFILKVDSDIFVNVPLLATLLSRHGDRNSVYGYIYPNSVVARTGKWAVAETALPIAKYPIYAAGNAYVVSTDAVKVIVELASRFPYVLVEDAFITGILASVGRVNRVNVAGFTKWTQPRPDPCDFVTDKVYVGNNFTEYDLRVFWREIVDRGRYRCDV